MTRGINNTAKKAQRHIEVFQCNKKTEGGAKQYSKNGLIEGMQLMDENLEDPLLDFEISPRVQAAVGEAKAGDTLTPLSATSLSDTGISPRTQNPAGKIGTKESVKLVKATSLEPAGGPPASAKADRKRPAKAKQAANVKQDTKAEQVTQAKPARRPVGRSLKISVAALAVLLIAAGIAFWSLGGEGKKKAEKAEYDQLLVAVSRTKDLKQRVELLKVYADSDNPEIYVQSAIDKIGKIQRQIISGEYAHVDQRVQELSANGRLEEAISAYLEFEKQYPVNHYAKVISARLKQLRARLETREFKTLNSQSQLRPDERIAAYKAFLDKYPHSKYRETVLFHISDMADAYYTFIERRILEVKAIGDWQQSIELCQQYINEYPESDHVVILKKYQNLCREELAAARSFEVLLREAEQLGTDYNAVMNVYTDFLEANPKTRSREKIKKEIRKLQEAKKAGRLKKAAEELAALIGGKAPRFTVTSSRTVLDSRTGMEWCLLDSRLALNRCLTYQEAASYAESLETAGHSDWRLPTPQELEILHSGKHLFPSLAEQWYWSSKAHKRYNGQQCYINVDVVGLSPVQNLMKAQKESWQCGTVRAVRQPAQEMASPIKRSSL